VAGARGFCGRPGLRLRSDERPGDAVHLWIHAAEPAGHDFHAGEDGSFAAAEARLVGARGVQVSTALTRSSARGLAGLPAWLHARGAAGWRVVVPRGTAEGVAPRLAVALPWALQALTQAQQRGLPAWIAGAPRCLLGPFTAAALPEPPRSFAPACAGCPARAEGCPGVEAGYLARFGAGELSPRALRPPAPAPAGTWRFPGTCAYEHVPEDRNARGPGEHVLEDRDGGAGEHVPEDRDGGSGEHVPEDRDGGAGEHVPEDMSAGGAGEHVPEDRRG
jgi:hypothetical protein